MTKKTPHHLRLIKHYALLRFSQLFSKPVSNDMDTKKAVFVIGNTASRRRLNRQVPKVNEEFPKIATSCSDTIGM